MATICVGQPFQFSELITYNNKDEMLESSYLWNYKSPGFQTGVTIRPPDGCELIDMAKSLSRHATYCTPRLLRPAPSRCASAHTSLLSCTARAVDAPPALLSQSGTLRAATPSSAFPLTTVTVTTVHSLFIQIYSLQFDLTLYWQHLQFQILSAERVEKGCGRGRHEATNGEQDKKGTIK
jgi:hypothetical protein